MIEISAEETKKIELEILLNVTKFCEANQLRYYLTYGTLIGAIRHKGFIPWDDDVDIQMPREDYNKLIELYHHEYIKVVVPGTPMAKHSIIKVIDTRTIKTEPVFNYPNGVLGIDIDIFPIDGTPDDGAEFETWYKKLRKCYENFFYTSQIPNGNLRHKLKILISKIFLKKPEYYIKQAAMLHAKYPYDSSQYVGSIESLFNSPQNRVPRECFEHTVEVDFEGEKFKAPIGYDQLLKNIYGDYMQLPPEEKRVTHHTHKTFWKD